MLFFCLHEMGSSQLPGGTLSTWAVALCGQLAGAARQQDQGRAPGAAARGRKGQRSLPSRHRTRAVPRKASV